MLPSIRKLAIAVTFADAGTDMVGGMPAGPSVSKECPMISQIRKKLSINPYVPRGSEGGVGDAISEGMRETADKLSRKFGSDQFVGGFLEELKTAMPSLVERVRTRAQHLKPFLPAPSGIIREQLNWRLAVPTTNAKTTRGEGIY